ncbi:hypothetical protein RFI_20411 [Reticulomyxa filosa]|uniref:Uncharacterized protein n=1 Tax=Reticulomyxa filosa TaxID=46433 RepID=X6MSY8_RETFI|nr:hypothetical protein RFI_20411 [Reticulomyxa filosa]|eukprot:ETO16929.1 hypothetical protein RFI_20411 [Reticulomyxa filosa]
MRDMLQLCKSELWTMNTSYVQMQRENKEIVRNKYNYETQIKGLEKEKQALQQKNFERNLAIYSQKEDNIAISKLNVRLKSDFDSLKNYCDQLEHEKISQVSRNDSFCVCNPGYNEVAPLLACFFFFFFKKKIKISTAPHSKSYGGRFGTGTDKLMSKAACTFLFVCLFSYLDYLGSNNIDHTTL